MSETQHLFVYGTLAPGQPNEHILSDLSGTWQPATVKGYLKQQGWGADMGYPGLILDKAGEEIKGFLLSSGQLSAQWDVLDTFEGDQYNRVVADVFLDDGNFVKAHLYVLSLLHTSN
ncbi:MAG: gamma-glutamylcyclotransferase [Vampirovibrio sp.]|nr:gamma-glutamylcyclotransferase [Vampirovibrio sp.]